MSNNYFKKQNSNNFFELIQLQQRETRYEYVQKFEQTAIKHHEKKKKQEQKRKNNVKPIQATCTTRSRRRSQNRGK